jgi:hypothetical protein
MTLTRTQTITALRAWAAGSHPLVAAVELLARAAAGRFAAPDRPWIHTHPATATGASAGEGEGQVPRARLEAGVLADAATYGPYSGGERRLLAVAASLAGAGPVDLCEVIPGLDRELLDLVLAAIAHAGGSHEHPLMRPHPGLDGALAPTRDLSGPLHPWPTTAHGHGSDHDPNPATDRAADPDRGPVRGPGKARGVSR